MLMYSGVALDTRSYNGLINKKELGLFEVAAITVLQLFFFLNGLISFLFLILLSKWAGLFSLHLCIAVR